MSTQSQILPRVTKDLNWHQTLLWQISFKCLTIKSTTSLLISHYLLFYWPFSFLLVISCKLFVQSRKHSNSTNTAMWLLERKPKSLKHSKAEAAFPCLEIPVQTVVCPSLWSLLQPFFFRLRMTSSRASLLNSMLVT